MQIQTVLLIILAAVVALVIVLFQYYYKTKKRGQIGYLLSFLRFLTFFGAFLLLINPKFTKYQYTTEKANLILLTDNSSSMAEYEDDIRSVLDKIHGDSDIGQRFNVQSYNFGKSLSSDSLSLSESQTNITRALKALEEIYSNSNAVIAMLTDGNQTVGQDYEFYGRNQETPIYPIAIGDTTSYEDISISQVNANRYAFLKNKYPLEIFVSYSGASQAQAQLRVLEDGEQVYQERVSLSNSNTTKVVSTLLDAGSVGLKNIVVTIDALANERNEANNSRELAVEVIDEKTNISIISNLSHPDIGALKKAIESNQQRSVSIMKPNTDRKKLEETDLFIFYQPDVSFKSIYDYLSQSKTSVFTITGSQTNWNFLNNAQNSFAKKSYEQTEEVSATLNTGFGLFNVEDFTVTDFPPVTSNLGEIQLRVEADIALSQRIKGVELNQPLLAIINNAVQKEAVFFGEDIWKWRMQSYRSDQNFKNFDDFLGKIVLYLTSNKSRDRLTLDYESVFTGSQDAKISATYFDNAFVFDSNANITLTIKNIESQASSEIPMLLKGSYYEADLSNLIPGKYDFTVAVKSEGISKSGRLSILDFDIEKQFFSTDFRKLDRVAENTGGRLFYSDDIDAMLDTLNTDQRYVPTQLSDQNIVSLIDFEVLLAIIALALASEWFIRKYIGLT
ncbi:VWA domain-containing protein [Pseudozobellia sp. WGM2]|uniref:VWA domain-containing protein n=1 Tax=Pseudozobellia sp. WGM2 TaxID=2787625 RepID=UPI001ADF1A1E|nr:VWA domain-containing protein [Pseudozobellia sp. WGM2]